MSLFINICFDSTIQTHGSAVFCEDNELSSKTEEKSNIKEQTDKIGSRDLEAVCFFDIFAIQYCDHAFNTHSDKRLRLPPACRGTPKTRRSIGLPIRDSVGRRRHTARKSKAEHFCRPVRELPADYKGRECRPCEHTQYACLGSKILQHSFH